MVRCASMMQSMSRLQARNAQCSCALNRPRQELHGTALILCRHDVRAAKVPCHPDRQAGTGVPVEHLPHAKGRTWAVRSCAKFRLQSSFFIDTRRRLIPFSPVTIRPRFIRPRSPSSHPAATGVSSAASRAGNVPRAATPMSWRQPRRGFADANSLILATRLAPVRVRRRHVTLRAALLPDHAARLQPR